MGELGLILIGALLVNNFVLAQFLGLCPFMGVTRQYQPAVAMGLATAFVLTTSAAISHLLYYAVLVPLDVTYLRIVVFIVAIASVVQATERVLRAASPLLHEVLGIYLPLITSNCAVLAVALLAIGQSLSFVETLVYGVGAALGFSLVMVLFAALRERLEHAPVPEPFRGVPVALITAGILSLGFMGFAGLAD
ncbi:MAG: electron transport complex subunit RsxA [Gammaproteobacteria bacterium]|nr:electron transport complex subunit RsxA [Gammaproteobacteria bacterium]